jgi:hypothetical protein
MEYEGYGCIRKSQADIAAARVAVENLPGALNLTVSISIPQDNGNVIFRKRAHTLSDFYDSIAASNMYVLIDYENVNKLQCLHNTFSGAASIYKFLGYSHHKAETNEASHIVHSGGSDAVDHAISVFVGMIVAKWGPRKQCIVVLTKDQFAERLHNLSRSGEETPVIHLPSERLCVEFLKTHGYEQSSERIVYED